MVHQILTIPALMLNRSERSMPGLRATPAEISTTSAPTRAGLGSSPQKTFYFHVSRDMAQVRRHARSDRGNIAWFSSEPAGQAVFQQQMRGLPMPPAAPERQLSRINSTFKRRFKVVSSWVNADSCAPHLKDPL